MQNLENLDVFEILISQKTAKMSEGPFCQIRAHIYIHALQTTFIMAANNMNPDQTAPKGSYCLQFRLRYQYILAMEKQTKFFINKWEWLEKG